MIMVILSDTVRLRLAWARKSDLKTMGGNGVGVETTKALVIFFCRLCFCRHFAGEETAVYTLLTWDLFSLLQTLS